MFFPLGSTSPTRARHDSLAHGYRSATFPRQPTYYVERGARVKHSTPPPRAMIKLGLRYAPLTCAAVDGARCAGSGFRARETPPRGPGGLSRASAAFRGVRPDAGRHGAQPSADPRRPAGRPGARRRRVGGPGRGPPVGGRRPAAPSPMPTSPRLARSGARPPCCAPTPPLDADDGPRGEPIDRHACPPPAPPVSVWASTPTIPRCPSTEASRSPSRLPKGLSACSTATPTPAWACSSAWAPCRSPAPT